MPGDKLHEDMAARVQRAQAERQAPEHLIEMTRREIRIRLQTWHDVQAVKARLVVPWSLAEKADDGEAWQRLGLTVIWSVGREDDGLMWLHVSASKRGAQVVMIPTHSDMKFVKELFVGTGRYAYAVWPAEDTYVNIHPGVLHLFACLDTPAERKGRVLPEFSAFTGSI